MTRPITILAACFLLLLIAPNAVRGDPQDGAILDSPDFPPEGNPADCEQLFSAYEAPEEYNMIQGYYLFDDPVLQCFEQVEREWIDDHTERQTFAATLRVVVESSHIYGVPILIQGMMETITSTGATEGEATFEIVAFDFVANLEGRSIVICESASSTSTGTYSTVLLGDGRYECRSSFDLYVESDWDMSAPAPRLVHMDLVSLRDTTPIATGWTWGQVRARYR